MNCSNCNKELKTGEREFAEKNNVPKCAECLYHELNGTDTIEAYNAWLKKEQSAPRQLTARERYLKHEASGLNAEYRKQVVPSKPTSVPHYGFHFKRRIK
jgi:hypothetical protein